MSVEEQLNAQPLASGDPTTIMVLNALPHPVVMIGSDDHISYANAAAEAFFGSSAAFLARKRLEWFVAADSPLLSLILLVRESNSPTNEYRVDLSSPRLGVERVVDIHVAPVQEQPESIVVMFQERTMADKMDRQLTHRGAARTVTGLAAMLAHEIKNPLSGIRGAAQLLDSSLSDDDRQLTHLIQDESDRIVRLVDRMEVFSDERPIERDPINIHSILERVKALTVTGFGRGIDLVEDYDPSLPPVFANRDQLIQVFINLAKNSCESMEGRDDAKLTFSTAFRPGVRLSVPATGERISLPLEICVSDNGPGVPEDILAHMFDPFVTSKSKGSGLGLALVAKIIGDHGGVIECDSLPGNTRFRVLLPTYDHRGAGGSVSHETQ
ncbi:MAG: ATP-binding protein [Pseudomonadota bacterium]